MPGDSVVPGNGYVHPCLRQFETEERDPVRFPGTVARGSTQKLWRQALLISVRPGPRWKARQHRRRDLGRIRNLRGKKRSSLSSTGAIRGSNPSDFARKRIPSVPVTVNRNTSAWDRASRSSRTTREPGRCNANASTSFSPAPSSTAVGTLSKPAGDSTVIQGSRSRCGKSTPTSLPCSNSVTTAGGTRTRP